MSHFKIYPTKNYIKNPFFWGYQRFCISKIEKTSQEQKHMCPFFFRRTVELEKSGDIFEFFFFILKKVRLHPYFMIFFWVIMDIVMLCPAQVNFIVFFLWNTCVLKKTCGLIYFLRISRLLYGNLDYTIRRYEFFFEVVLRPHSQLLRKLYRPDMVSGWSKLIRPETYTYPPPI